MKVLDPIETTDGDILELLIWLDNSLQLLYATDYDYCDFAAPFEVQEAAFMDAERSLLKDADNLYALVSY